MSQKRAVQKRSKVRKSKKKQKVTFNDVEDDVLEVLNKALKDKK